MPHPCFVRFPFAFDSSLGKEILFSDDFDDGIPDGCALEPRWTLEKDNENYLLRGSGNHWAARKINSWWFDYAIEPKVRFISMGLVLCYITNDG